MTTTMDSAGRVVLPKAARERAGIRPGAELEVRVIDGRIELEPAPARVTIEQQDGFWVAVPAEVGPVLTHDDVEATVDAIRLRSLPAVRTDV